MNLNITIASNLMQIFLDNRLFCWKNNIRSYDAATNN